MNKTCYKKSAGGMIPYDSIGEESGCQEKMVKSNCWT